MLLAVQGPVAIALLSSNSSCDFWFSGDSKVQNPQESWDVLCAPQDGNPCLEGGSYSCYCTLPAFSAIATYPYNAEASEGW